MNTVLKKKTCREKIQKKGEVPFISQCMWDLMSKCAIISQAHDVKYQR